MENNSNLFCIKITKYNENNQEKYQCMFMLKWTYYNQDTQYQSELRQKRCSSIIHLYQEMEYKCISLVDRTHKVD